MDPLSVAASIAGILSAAAQIGKALGPYASAAKETPQITAHVQSEVLAASIILSSLQHLTQNLASVPARNASYIGVEQVVAVLTDGVLLFSELETAVQKLPPHDPGSLKLPLRARLQWARKEGTFSTLLIRLQAFKSSITLILTILQR